MKTPTKPIFQLKKRNPRIWAIAFGCYTRPHLKIRVENCERSDNISNNNKKLPERLCKITNNTDLWSQYLDATPDHTSKSGSAVLASLTMADPDFEVWFDNIFLLSSNFLIFASDISSKKFFRPFRYRPQQSFCPLRYRQQQPIFTIRYPPN